jgi:hypothetical protein
MRVPDMSDEKLVSLSKNVPGGGRRHLFHAISAD